MTFDGNLTTLYTRLAASSGWANLRAAVRAGESGTIDGAWGSAGALAVVALAQECAGPLVVVLPNVADVTPWSGDVSSFLGVAASIFPAHDSWPPMPTRGRISEETSGRLRVLQQLTSESPPKIVLAPMAAIMQPVPVREDWLSAGRKVTSGETLDIEDLLLWLINHGFKRVESVEYPGEFTKRGGIVDLFPPDALDPVRLEFFGDELESIRTFAVQTQRSLVKKPELIILRADRVTRAGATPDRGFLTDYLPTGSVIALVEPNDLKEQGKHFLERVAEASGMFTVEGTFANIMTRPSVVVSAMPRASAEVSAHLHVESVERFSGNVTRVKEELDTIARTDHVIIACQTEAEIHRLQEVLKAGHLAESQRLALVTGHVRQGFRLVGAEGVVVLGSHQIFHRDLLPPGAKTKPETSTSRRVEGRAIDSFLELNEGDYVVHIAHGIAKFRGMRMLARNAMVTGSGEADDIPLSAGDILEENLILEFRDGVCLYVPASRIDLVQRYVGGSQVQPELSKLGGTAWARKKDRVTEAVRDMAADMIQLQAVRAALPGMALPTDSEWQKEFEDAFPFQETPDQLSAIHEIKADQEKPKPMDRLLCGDVGYGKTEVAVRAAFKAIDNGKQVAVLVPTTVLAEQHFRTFTARLAEYPFTVEVLSRFKTAAQQKETLKRAEAGGVDILIGTHRVVSKDVKFKDLGLVIIDEEQRFGVEHKDRLKMLRTSVDVLTMTATPIPRTLHSALLGIREISNLETPPPERYPVETRIIRWEDDLLRHTIHREFNRGGQVYFVHNRVHDIEAIAAEVQRIVPEAKIVIGHGQMAEGVLEKAMVKFVKKEADILVATTIIESGLDIPNANTMIINDADMYGLADLHQLRGRVGRTKLRAYAYLIVDARKMMTPNAQKRLKAIEEFSELGAGFKISMRDLEIRGAGNLLGSEQSGHIAAIGYEMYCQLLENAVRQLNHQPPKVAIEVNVDLPWPAFLPRDYVPGQKLRIEVYRRLARLRDLKTLADFRTELTDRYGPPPEAAEWLLKATEIRILCVRWNIHAVHRENLDLVFSYRNRKKAEELAKASGTRLKVVDDKSLYLRLKPDQGEEAPPKMYALLRRVLG
jgi:transcription-repair coupling factor (superfamily II helicase)